MPEEYPWDEDEVVGVPKDEQPAPSTEEPDGEEPPPEEPPPPAPPSRQPELGDAVHFVLPVGPSKGQDRFALVSLVLQGEGDGDRQQGLVDLHVFGLPADHPNVTSTHLVRFAQRVPYNPGGEPGTWHWPGEGGGQAKNATR